MRYVRPQNHFYQLKSTNKRFHKYSEFLAMALSYWPEKEKDPQKKFKMYLNLT